MEVDTFEVVLVTTIVLALRAIWEIDKCSSPIAEHRLVSASSPPIPTLILIVEECVNALSLRAMFVLVDVSSEFADDIVSIWLCSQFVEWFHGFVPEPLIIRLRCHGVDLAATDREGFVGVFASLSLEDRFSCVVLARTSFEIGCTGEHRWSFQFNTVILVLEMCNCLHFVIYLK